MDPQTDLLIPSLLDVMLQTTYLHLLGQVSGRCLKLTN